MADANFPSNTGGSDSRNDMSDICHDLKELQNDQSRLVEQMERFTLTLSALLDGQKRLHAQFATIAERCLAQRPTEPCNMPTNNLEAVAGAYSQTMAIAPYPQFNAGLRLTNVLELLEMILLELPSENILFAQRTSRQFRTVIAQSRPIQRRLFLTTLSDTSPSENIILNPIITKQRTIPHIPLYFDEAAMTMAYCGRPNRKRVYCTRAAIGKDETTGEGRINLELTDVYYSVGANWNSKPRQRPFEAGSWKQMCLAQPPCGVKWHLKIGDRLDKNWERRYSGTFTSKCTMDAFLEAFAASVVVDEGEGRRSSP